MMMCELLAIQLYRESGDKICRRTPWMELHETQREIYRKKAGLIGVGAIGSVYHLEGD